MSFRSNPRPGGPPGRRPAVHTEALLACTAIFLMLTGNGPFWHAALEGRPWAAPGTWLFAGAVFVSLSALYFALAAPFVTRFTARPLLALMLLVTAAASYYMDRYAIYLDRTMVRNVFATNPKEATELLGWGLAGHMLLLGVLPAALLWWPRILRRPPGRALAVRLGWIVVALVLCVGGALAVFADFASMMRNHREMRWLITPGNVVAAVAGELAGDHARQGPRQVTAGDARAPARTGRPVLFVLVVGETARARNFSLDGYARDTNPELSRRDVVNFPQATSCGTSTEVSLPCMFSRQGRRHYDESAILSHESVLQVLARVGVKVLWRDNQSGCKGVCDGLPTEQLDSLAVPGLCGGGQCFDEILVRGLDAIVDGAKGDTLVVLHMLGSHGPAYFRRYPQAYRRFTPPCESDDLRQCDSAQIVNAFDNTILYTDAVVAKAIDVLKAHGATHDTALLYVSDHGESLGEGGLYLHGVPYAIAPEVQTHVPFVFWSSPSFAEGRRLDLKCLAARAKEPVSHDNLFHSLLGVFDVTTQAYERPMDVLGGCRQR